MTTDVTIINTPVSVTITQADGPAVIIQAPPIYQVSTSTVGIQGPPGPSGGGGGGATTVLAAQALGGQRVVTVTGFHASPADANAIAGITKAAGAIGTNVEIVVQGLMSEPSWTWTPAAPVFVGLLGVLTQSPPASGNLRRVAWALSATTINVDFSPTITQA